MKKTALLAGTAIIGLSLLSGSAVAQNASGNSFDAAVKPSEAVATPKPSSMTDADKREYKRALKEASTMMGHVGIANIALLHNITDEATENVRKALIIARELELQTARLNADAIKLGLLKYHSANGEKHDYWLPIENDTLIVNNIDAEFLMAKEPKAAMDDAQIVNTKVTLDVQRVRELLEKATSAISAGNYIDAQAALSNAEQSTFTYRTISELPLATIRDNLALAKELAKTKDYEGASFALTHAKNGLLEYKKTAKDSEVKQLEILSDGISALQTRISKDRPSIVDIIETRIGGWVHEIESIIK